MFAIQKILDSSTALFSAIVAALTVGGMPTWVGVTMIAGYALKEAAGKIGEAWYHSTELRTARHDAEDETRRERDDAKG